MMEFHEKLQELRKQRGLTQEELAQSLFVSRTAISRWESGRGYPSIDSLKAIAKFFSVTVDELLSGDEVLTLAEEDRRRREHHLCGLVFGLLDLSTAMLLFLPFFGQKSAGTVTGVSLLNLSGIAPYLKAAYFVPVVGLILWGILLLALQNCRQSFWVRNKHMISLLLNLAGVLLFIISLQPYAAVLLLLFLIIKASLLLKRH